MSAKVKEVAREEAERVRSLASQAVSSGTYAYPLRGFLYFLSHRSLWKPMQSKLAPVISTGVGVTTFMFVFTYLPQAAILTIFNGPLAALTTVLLVLSESSTISNLLSRTFFIDDALIDTFDGTLVSRGMTSLVSEGRQIKPGSDPIGKLGKLMKKPFARFSPDAIIRYIIYLPLNLIPVVGTVMFIILRGRKAGPAAHARYFQLKGMKSHQKEDFIEQRKAAYTSFGVPAVLLELIPVVGLFFSFTNTVGAALWAADMEQNNTTAPNLREQAAKAE
ncbi:hypothetical protein SLS55_003316 [Diplodia seriata]|uniref:Regulator of rDNA transcription protein 8 n=1 Tax=Diplodia seriata TaxID=420778 RepID=A0A0G2EI75_9PEZI|nr:hypothetical protein UCDDS831_g03930 [Diplodia seriata]OMP88940.1 Regulator of rDNA transcription protein 8 [Diplodia seriata]